MSYRSNDHAGAIPYAVRSGDLFTRPALAPQPTPPLPRLYNEPTWPDPHLSFGELTNILKKDPYSHEKWHQLLDMAENSGDIHKIREAYELLLSFYPNTAAAQIKYIQHYTNDGGSLDLNATQALFKQWMNNSASVELFKLYLHHIKYVFTRRCDVQTVHRAYEFALDCIGHDKDAGEVWLDYINFIDGPIPLRDWRKSGSRSITAKEAVVRINDMRRLYRRALQIPLVLLDTIWDAYCEFENTVSTQTADMMITSMQNEHEPSYTIARQQLRFLDVVGFLQQLSPVQPAALELPTRPRPSSSFQDENSDSLCHRWLCYLNWEEGNPLLFDLKTMEGEKEFVRRMKGVYKKAVLKLRFYEVIWYRWFVWYNELKGDKQSDKHNPLTILQTGIEANPTSLLLNFVLAEQYEIQQNHEEVHRVYTALIAVLQKELDGIERHLSQPSANKTEDASSTSFSHEDMSNQEGPSETLRGIFQKRIEELGSVWCEYMTFARRSRDQVASREIFAQARKSKHLDWRVFDYAAMTEYHLSKAAKIATKIYDLGLKRYPTDAGFICQYLHFLVIINDESNARLLFEKVIANPTLTPEKARHIWDKWCSFECNFGDLASSHKMQKRMLEIYTAGKRSLRPLDNGLIRLLGI
ncbi:Suf-domain-containing protein [Sistotremastrum niveocremeum HHB9708]|uniref:mRNA 3'-end-processing protein RNA14 n=1 Tax=Sistotremastrum niveocremeum HHB9708 TaxID=1314777 RepID=A0A164RVH7_9AGAM|nr:Suf-domain-containing protein [Sistotremastrum niveocremeum HHB9708]